MRFTVRKFISAFICAVLLLTIIAPSKRATSAGLSSLSIIRDVEIESALYEWITPIVKAANLNIDNIKIILVQSDQVNAFVAGGQNIFIYTALIEKTETPDELLGVLAHELGHIAGGHLILGNGAMRRASYETILGTVLGIGAAIIAGDGRLATAVGMGAQNIAARNYLSHSRTNESSADQAALTFFERAHYSPNGLISFFEKLQDQELLPASQQNEFVRTHPITANRIEAIKRKANASPYTDKPLPQQWYEQHARMKAKLVSFIRPQHVPWIYHDDDQSFPARYARAIAAYRESKINTALSQINALITEEPQNPYLWELKGQMLTDFSRISDALPALRKTVELAPKAALFHATLGHGLIEEAEHDLNNNKSLLNEAIQHLNIALQDEPNSIQNHRLLATAYGRLHLNNEADLELAEVALLRKETKRAQDLAKKVIKNSEKSEKSYIKANDVLDYVKKNNYSDSR